MALRRGQRPPAGWQWPAGLRCRPDSRVDTRGCPWIRPPARRQAAKAAMIHNWFLPMTCGEKLACDRLGAYRHRFDQPKESSEEHTSELQSLMRLSFAVLCLKKKNN